MTEFYRVNTPEELLKCLAKGEDIIAERAAISARNARIAATKLKPGSHKLRGILRTAEAAERDVYRHQLEAQRLRSIMIMPKD